MNEQVERRLDAESASESPGYVGTGHPGAGSGVPSGNGLMKEGPARWSTPAADVQVGPLASIEELLDVASSQER